MPDVEIPDLQKASDVLNECIREKGDDYIAACVYVQDNEPICIAGLAFHKVGIPLDFLAYMEGSSAAQVAIRYWNLPDVFYNNPALDSTAQFNRDYSGLWLINRSQFFQDTGMAWGPAVEKAVTEVGRTWPNRG